MTVPTLYYRESLYESSFHISAIRYENDSSEGSPRWDNNNIKLRAVWFGTHEATFNFLSDILSQAGVVLIRD